jgi:hypothetical protein
MKHRELGTIVRKATKESVIKYLSMCGLDSPWEVPESYLAAKVAETLGQRGHRVAIEFKLDRADNAPGSRHSITRLATAWAHLDLAILGKTQNPWNLRVSGAIEFKKHAYLNNDAELIQLLFEPPSQIDLGMLVLFVVGSTAKVTQDEAERLTVELTKREGSFWRMDDPVPEYTINLFATKNADEVRDRYWDVRCLTPRTGD